MLIPWLKANLTLQWKFRQWPLIKFTFWDLIYRAFRNLGGWCALLGFLHYSIKLLATNPSFPLINMYIATRFGLWLVNYPNNFMHRPDFRTNKYLITGHFILFGEDFCHMGRERTHVGPMSLTLDICRIQRKWTVLATDIWYHHRYMEIEW